MLFIGHHEPAQEPLSDMKNTLLKQAGYEFAGLAGEVDIERIFGSNVMEIRTLASRVRFIAIGTEEGKCLIVLNKVG